MTSSAIRASTVCTTHTTYVAAPPRAVYDLIADPSRWPYTFSSTVHVERVGGGATEERLRLWAVANGAVRSWISHRALDRDGLRIRFQHETPSPPVELMAGEWVLVPLSDNATSVVLLHEFRAIGDDPANIALIKQAVDRSSTEELAALKSTAELGDRLSMLVHTFADSVTVEAGHAPVYDFLYRVQEWPRRLPHVSRLTVDEVVPNVQTVEMDAYGRDGSVHTTRSVRVCFPYHSIVYKHTQLPAIISAHLGGWHLYPTVNGVRVTSQHTVLIRPERIGKLLGPDATVDQVRDLIREALCDDSLAVLMHAKDAAERLCPARTAVAPGMT